MFFWLLLVLAWIGAAVLVLGLLRVVLLLEDWRDERRARRRRDRFGGYVVDGPERRGGA